MALKTPSLDQLRATWDRLQRLPGGKRIFNKLLGYFVPYTGTIEPQVEEVRPGYARVFFDDRRGVRNHLNSVHAIALVNLAELAANLALIGGLPKGGRMIITGISIEYLKKARGRITAESRCPVPTTLERTEYDNEVSLRDENGVEVARARVKALIDAAKS
jgi:acyl-coenzyme A thioesterase PaaI-like protein